MHLMYVDESGDPGRSQYSSPHFILSGLVLSQEDWSKALVRLKAFRKAIKDQYNLNQRVEIHAAELIRINKNEAYRSITKANRLSILRDFSKQIPIIFSTAKLINICLKKSDFEDDEDIQGKAWARLIQRYDTYLKKTAKDKGIIVADDTDAATLISLLRKMRVYNPVPSHYSAGGYNAPTDNIIEDIFQRGSHDSYFIQAVDVVAHLLYRKEFPKGSLKKFGLEHFFEAFEPILLKEASKGDPYGVVRK